MKPNLLNKILLRKHYLKSQTWSEALSPYSIIQALNPDNLPEVTVLEEHNELVDKFVESSVMNMLTFLIPRFRDIIKLDSGMT